MECNAAKEILLARNYFDQPDYPKIEFRLLSDSNYIFYYQKNELAGAKTEMANGRYYIKSDTIVFFPNRFEYINCDKAIIREGFVEFLNGKRPMRLKITRTTLPLIERIDTARFKDYVFFSFNPKHYSCFSDNVEPVFLDNS